jgi:hypothetical protein
MAISVRLIMVKAHGLIALKMNAQQLGDHVLGRRDDIEICTAN